MNEGAVSTVVHSGGKRLCFTVLRAPVSTNAMYIRRDLSHGGKGLTVTKAARDFKEAVRSHAYAAARSCNWPKPEKVKRVAVAIVVYNTRHDCSAAEKLVCDGMEGVAYANDKVAHPRINDIAKDDGPQRVEVAVELLEVG